MDVKFNEPVFDYRSLRLLVGHVAFALPLTVVLMAQGPLVSISAAYHTEARNAFVSMLIFVGTFLLAYNGHSQKESWASKIAALATALVALSPAAESIHDITPAALIHAVAAFVLFSILAYFCLGPFRKKLRGKTGKKRRRNQVYILCGTVIIASLTVCAVLTLLSWQTPSFKPGTALFWAETCALSAFGFAWIVAGKYYRYFVDAEDALRIRK